PEEFAEDFQDYNDYGLGNDKSGFIYFLSMDLRICTVSGVGDGQDILNDQGLDAVLDQCYNYLSKDKSNSYYKSCESFLNDIEYMLEKYQSGQYYGVDYKISRFKPNIIVLIVLFGIGLLSGYIVVEGYKSDMNTNLGSTVASDYIMKNSFKLTTKNDTFVSTNTAKVRIPTDSGTRSGGGSSYSSSHTSSSGRVHSTGSRRF
nr:hypothetical protein [Lachnospiraceae bacterium]